MNSSSPRIVFMGSPEFAVASLEAILEAGWNVVAVVTAPDKPAGRGMRPQGTAVKAFAQVHGLKVLQPQKLKDPEFIQSLKDLRPDLQVVVAFRMLPEVVWNLPPMGTINLHGSLLPQYRGAAPLQWAIINGETQTGVTTFKLKQEIDTGDILLQKTIPIRADETAGELHDEMKKVGAGLVVETIRGLVEGSIQEKPQILPTADQVRSAPKIFTETCRIAWQNKVLDIFNLVRGLSPFPAAFTLLDGKMLKIFRAVPEPSAGDIPVGAWVSDGKTFLKFAASDGFLRVLEIQLEGKKKMGVEEFLRGYRLPPAPVVG